MRQLIAAVLVVGLVVGVRVAGQRGQQPCQSVDAQTPRPAADLIGIARCWDDRYAFPEAERILVAAIAAAESQAASVPDEITGGPVFVGGNVATPAMANSVKGDYPEKAAARGIAGTVVVQVTLKPDGSVDKAEIVDSIPDLDAAALSMVKKMRFARTLLADKPAEVSFFVPARFGLPDVLEPGDWMTLAQSYLSHGHPAAAVQALRSALELERRDIKRFGPSLRRVGGAPGGSGSVQAPRQTTHTTPKYPQYALSARAQGVVIIEAVVDPEGKVGRAKVLKSAQGFDVAALDAVRQWRYEPALVDGKPVSCVMAVTVSFNVK